MFLEKQILDHLGYDLKQSGYIPSEQENKCIQSYDRSPILSGLTTFSFFGVRLCWLTPRHSRILHILVDLDYPRGCWSGVQWL